MSLVNALKSDWSQILSSGNGLTLSKQALVFTCLQCKSLQNTIGKEEIAQNKQFLLFPQCILTHL